MNNPTSKEGEPAFEFPLLPRQLIIKGLLQLNVDDLRALMGLWIKNSLQAEAHKKKTEANKEDLEFHAQRLDNDLKKLTKRNCVVRWLDDYLGSKLNPVQQAQLELSSVLRRPKRMQWTTYHLIKSPSTDNAQDSRTNHKHLEMSLKESLAIYFPTIVYVARNEGNFWIRVAIFTGPDQLKHPKVYIVFRPSTKFVVMSPVPGNIRAYLFQALCEVLRVDSIEQIALSGSNPLGLLDLILFKHSQGAFSQYRLGQIEDGPLQLNSQAAILSSKNCLTKRSYSGVVDEERFVKGRKRFSALREFGPNPQPELDKLRVKFVLNNESPGKGVHINSSTSIPFEMSVKFEGSNVIEGLKILASKDKLPTYLSQVHSKGTSCLEVDQLDSDVI